MKLIIDDGQEFEISSVKSCDLKLGDIIILRTQNTITRDGHDNIIKSMNGIFPYNKTIILEEGMDLEILRKDYITG